MSFGSLHTTYIGDGRRRLDKDFTYHHRKYGLITAPAGFETDIDSVHRLPVVYWLFKNRTVKAAIIHDWLYYCGKITYLRITRKIADQVFLDAMKDEGVRWWRRRMIWLGVRAGGWWPWNRHRERDRRSKKPPNAA